MLNVALQGRAEVNDNEIGLFAALCWTETRITPTYSVQEETAVLLIYNKLVFDNI